MENFIWKLEHISHIFFNSMIRYFLEHGYAVIFLHRNRSLQPFTRHLPQKRLLDILEVQTRTNGEVAQLCGNLL